MLIDIIVLIAISGAEPLKTPTKQGIEFAFQTPRHQRPPSDAQQRASSRRTRIRHPKGLLTLLPYEVLSCIFKYLNINDLINVSSVSVIL